MKRLIFVVDDEPTIADVMAMVLNRTTSDLAAMSLHSAEEVVRVSRAVRPDLVLLDVRMPEVKGLEHAIYLRDQLGIPVMLISGSPTTATLLQSADESGVAPFTIVAKPIHPSELIEAIRAQFVDRAATLGVSGQVGDLPTTPGQVS